MELDPQAALRVLCGLWFVPHAVLKLINAGLAQQTFASVGLRPGWLFLYLTVALESVAMVGLVSDIHPRIAAAAGVVVLIGASYAVVRLNGPAWRWNKHGPEYMIFWSLACILSVI